MKLGEDVDWLGVELRSGTTSKYKWSSGKSYLFILKPKGGFELQKMVRQSADAGQKDNYYYYKDVDSWMNVEFRT